MTIRSTSTFDSEPVDDLIAYADSFNEIAQEEFNAVWQPIQTAMLRELKTVPGRVRYPIDWTSAKQRRFVMMTLRRNNNLPYQRTGRIPAAWQASARFNGGQIQAIVENSEPASRFVYGSLARNGGGFQQRFHRNTGWQEANQTVAFWFTALQQDFIQAMQSRLGDLGRTTGRRRAFTSRRRN